MEFGIEKRFPINNEKQEKTTKGIPLPNEERVRPLGEKENYKYLGI